MAGVTPGQIQSIVRTSEYVPMTLVSLACQINKSLGDTKLERTSVTECIKGATIRLPPGRTSPTDQAVRAQTSARADRPSSQRQPTPTPFMDQKSSRLLGFGVNTITFLVLGYFLGGFALNPILGFSSCEGLSPCVGSVIGLFVSALGSLAYTYYYFVKRV